MIVVEGGDSWGISVRLETPQEAKRTRRLKPRPPESVRLERRTTVPYPLAKSFVKKLNPCKNHATVLVFIEIAQDLFRFCCDKSGDFQFR